MSKELSYMLRHKPEFYNIKLSNTGYANVKEVLKVLRMSFKELSKIVNEDTKKRYSFNKDKLLIKANQGHSIKIDLELEAITPPEYLYHGTVDRFIKSIEKSGLKKMKRHHVHLSEDKNTAHDVASRRKSKSILLRINSMDMFNEGYSFYLTENSVWLTNDVPYKYIEKI